MIDEQFIARVEKISYASFSKFKPAKRHRRGYSPSRSVVFVAWTIAKKAGFELSDCQLEHLANAAPYIADMIDRLPRTISA